MKKDFIKAFFDGACWPTNPGGIASYGAIIFKNGKRIWQSSEIYEPKVPKATSNNVAEYCGLIAVFEYLIANNYCKDKVRIFGDSKLVVMQMNHRWRILEGHYVPLAKKANELKYKFKDLQVKWIPRHQNWSADKLAKSYRNPVFIYNDTLAQLI